MDPQRLRWLLRDDCQVR